MFTAIFNVIAAMPALLSLVKQFVQWTAEQVELAEKRQLAKDMQAATQKAKETKDTRDIENLFKGGS
jgi:uncharacterized membrane protein (DUF106 family)